MEIEFVPKTGWRNESQGPPVTKLFAEDLTRYESGIHRAQEMAVEAFEASAGAGAGGTGDVSWDDVSDKPAFIAAGASKAEARTAIGAGTGNSNLELGATADTAMPGDTAIPAAATWANIGKPAVVAAGATIEAAQEALGIIQLAAGAPVPVGTAAGALIFVRNP
ncbi:hypothetical protein [Rhodococcus erythropolis]|uniref:hypothetical protein n=1 Tax=Rhodococcus erythropolis TaxID=1833 RepID=UPI00367322BF